MKAVHVGPTRTLTGLWCFFAVVAGLLRSSDAHAQTVPQTFQLEVGWNAVYVEVDPDPSDLDVLLDGLAVESVWVREESGHGEGGLPCADDSDDSVCLGSTDTGWQVWFPPDQPQRVIRSLQSLRGGRVYLIEASEPATWTIRGRPNSSLTRWRKGFGLEGFHVVGQTDVAPTFGQYLGASPAHQDAAIYEINPDGSLSRIVDPTGQRITPGKGYWVEASHNTRYDGPIRIDPRSLRGVALLPGAAEAFIEIENLTDAQGSVTIADPTALGQAADSVESDGPAPLVWYDYVGGSTPQWRDLENLRVKLESKDAPGSKRTLRVGVRRAEAGDGDAGPAPDRVSVLTVTDEKGFRRWIPILSRGDEQNGLWVGEVTVNEVLSLTGEDTQPTPTSPEFVFRVIIHRSTAEYRLLREVVLVYDDAESSYTLVTPACFELLDSTRISPRVSSANFSFDDDVLLVGNFETQLAASIVSGATHSLNPFVHPFNPIHDEGFETTRNITLDFDTDGGGDPQWGVTRLTGTYEEIVLGLHRNQIEARGRFELRRVSYTETLCGP